MRLWIPVWTVITLGACTAEEPAAPPAEVSASGPASRPATMPTVEVDPFSTPKAAFAAQYDALQAVDVEGVERFMVESMRGKVTLEELEAAKERIGNTPVGDIARSVRVDGDVAEMVSVSGWVLTKLVRVDGKWLAQEKWWDPDKDKKDR